MVDLSHTDTLDDWLLSDTGVNLLDSHPLSSSLPPSPESSLPTSELPTVFPDDPLTNGKKRKCEEHAEHTEQKKSKQVPPYMRRNIRHLFTNEKLQVDTLTALKAEQERLQRLQDINIAYYQNNPFHTQPSSNHHQQVKARSTEQECIVLDDEDDNSSELQKLLKQNLHSDTNRRTADDDDDDSDIQCVDSDTESVNDRLTTKLQRLHVDDRVNIPDGDGNVLINVNHPTDEPDLYICKHLCPILKPHQIGGIRFMYDNIVESLQRFQTSPGLGCILAHSMGCGKTIQVITFIDVFLRHTTAKTVLIVVPINTIQNWATEFNHWCPVDDRALEYTRPYQLYLLNEASKKFDQRTSIVQNWSKTGGTLIIGYEMFRLLVTKKVTPARTSHSNRTINISSPSAPTHSELEEEGRNLATMEEVRNVLLNVDLVICDEGHRIKNHQAGVAIALKSIRTHHRIVLTGYPLQNNLIEYWCMVDFVRPNYLGRKQEFTNMFERPILNGQCVDSTGQDRQLMRARAHVLHSLLEGFIQRRGHDVLRSELPPKTEYVLLLKLSPVQRQLYMKFLEAVGALSNSTEKNLNPLRAFAICCKIWNHADVFYKSVRDRQDGSDADLDLELESTSDSTTRSLPLKGKPTFRSPGSQRASPQTYAAGYPYETALTPFSMEKKEFDYDFANNILNSYLYGQLSNGIKFEVALNIVDTSIQLGDKVLLFSQSLLSLNKFEEFLHQRSIPNTDLTWEKNVNYYRLDGGTNGLDREKLINAFNAPHSNVKLFLLSTRAGCLGINLIAANRVIVMDVSWNPCLDAQAVCRVYRYGQRKHCYIYRLIADFTMEKRIYDRQIAKQGMSDRVVDEMQPQNHFTRNEVENLLHFAAEEEPVVSDLLRKVLEISDDPVLVSTCQQYSQSMTQVPFTHESLLSDRKEFQMSSAEKRRAQKHYQEEKRMNAHSSRFRSQPSRASSVIPNPPRYFPSPVPQFPSMNTQVTLDRRFEQLKQQGVEVEEKVLENALEVRTNAFDRQIIPAGIPVHLIKSFRGTYIRTPDGKFFTIRQSPPPYVSQPKPPPPPPLSSDFFDDLFLSDLSPLPSNSSSMTNELNDEIDLLFFDPPSLSASSSAMNTTPLWQDDTLQSNHFYPDVFLNASNSNQYVSNPLTFT